MEFNEEVQNYSEETTVEKTNPVKKILGKLSPKVIIAAVAAILVIVIAVILFGGGNSYKTPIKVMEDRLNARSYSKYEKAQFDIYNGFCESEIKAIYKIYKSSDEYEDYLDEAKEYYEESIEDKEDEYGKNYKYTIKITDKDKLSSEELREFKKQIKEAGDDLEDELEEMKDYDSDDWEEMADEMGISKSQAKKVVKYMEKIAKKYSKVKVTAGYELECVRTLKGKEIDDPEDYEYEFTVKVYKVNGRWITSSAIGLNGMF